MARVTFLELPTKTIDASRQFFAEAFDWQMTMFGPTYASTMTGDVNVGLQASSTEAPTSPLAVIEVADLDSAYTAVVNAGGTITKEPFSFPGGRRFHFKEPGGNELAAWVTQQ